METHNANNVSAAKVHALNLGRQFGNGAKAVYAVDDFTLTVRRGEFVCLVGPSGCGKSTIVKMVAGLLPPSSGSISLYTDGARAPIATVFQNYGIFPWKTVRGNVELALRAHGVSKAESRRRGSDWIARLGLSDFRNAYPGTLSGGMQQRVAIARALALEPEILLMDEPFASLDAQLRELLQEELLTLSEEQQQTTIFVTHSLDEAIVLGDRVIVMSARPGRVIGEIAVPFPRPRDAAVRGSAEFAALRERLWESLRSEVTKQMAMSEAKSE